ncbi:MAG: biotin--[acetyl-CoA-carboxylase] ligase [Deltaproteobacteria bacterium]|nr:MAG: biotin--[acetyl-CoA-carboxylase] ligase [Deltaproteobacteria bacterium]
MKIIRLKEVDSTNNYALNLVKKNLPGLPDIITAENQDAGKGRLGKNWQSAPGKGLYCSIILQPRLAPADLAKSTLAAGLAVAAALEQEIKELHISLKWPNDLICKGKKMGGILLETAFPAGGGSPYIIAGIGININNQQKDFNKQIKDTATSLYLVTGRHFETENLLLPIYHQVREYITRLEQNDFAGLKHEWQQRDFLFGRNVKMVAVNKQVISGKAAGIDENGVLLVRDQGGRIHQILSGDISLAD